MRSAVRTFDDLVAEAESAPVDGWSFDWLEGRATEARPSWGFQQLIRRRFAKVSSALDLHTGGGEVLAGAGPFPPTMVAMESWPPNLALATKLLHPLGVAVIKTPADARLPFCDESFELVTSRHANLIWWAEISRVLRPGGTYLAQHVGPGTMSELAEYFGAQPGRDAWRHPDNERAEAQAAGLQIVDMCMEHLRAQFFDIGAVIYFLRKVIWVVPDFSVDRYRDRLHELHQYMVGQPFVAYSTRVLVEARKP